MTEVIITETDRNIRKKYINEVSNIVRRATDEIEDSRQRAVILGELMLIIDTVRVESLALAISRQLIESTADEILGSM